MASPVQYPVPVETVRPPVAVVSGMLTEVSVTQLKALAGVGTVYTFTAPFGLMRAGQPLHFKSGGSYVLDATLIAALQARSAPMVAA